MAQAQSQITRKAKQAGPAAGVTTARGNGAGRHEAWDARYARLYEQLWRPARTMVRRAFRHAFCDDEIEDLYGNAWLGTLRALRRRKQELTDEELRKYVLTAVANHASKELRRRGRKSTASLEMARGVMDEGALPDERAARREQSQIARDVLGTLPARRRAVLLFRYGWGLEPREVCGLIKGLSHRAYRKEITRGVDEVSGKLRLVEEGRWCGSREPLLKAYAAGIADAEQRRQAEHHLAHCRHCADYVGRLNGHLHELGSSITWAGVADAVDRRVSVLDRVGELVERGRDATLGAVTRGGSEPAEAGTQIVSTGGTRGAGAGAAGAVAKLAGLGAVPKIVAACVGTGAAATACVAAGITPIHLPSGEGDPAAVQRTADVRPDQGAVEANRGSLLASPVGPDAPAPQSPASGGGEEEPASDETAEATSPPAPAPAPAPASTPPPEEQEFGLAPAPSSSGTEATSSGVGSSGGGSSGGGGAAAREFGP